MKAEDKYINKQGEARRRSLFPDVPDEKWNDWHWQVSHRISDVDTLKNTCRLQWKRKKAVGKHWKLSVWRSRLIT